jgi:UDP:flavonoid glycosyltransferase YjiC (YdhE family)
MMPTQPCWVLMVHLLTLSTTPPCIALVQLDPWNFTAADLAEAVQQLLADEDTRARAAEMGRRLRARTPGPRRAAELIFEFAQA